MKSLKDYIFESMFDEEDIEKDAACVQMNDILQKDSNGKTILRAISKDGKNYIVNTNKALFSNFNLTNNSHSPGPRNIKYNEFLKNFTLQGARMITMCLNKPSDLKKWLTNMSYIGCGKAKIFVEHFDNSDNTLDLSHNNFQFPLQCLEIYSKEENVHTINCILPKEPLYNVMIYAAQARTGQMKNCEVNIKDCNCKQLMIDEVYFLKDGEQLKDCKAGDKPEVYDVNKIQKILQDNPKVQDLIIITQDFAQEGFKVISKRGQLKEYKPIKSLLRRYQNAENTSSAFFAGTINNENEKIGIDDMSLKYLLNEECSTPMNTLGMGNPTVATEESCGSEPIVKKKDIKKKKRP